MACNTKNYTEQGGNKTVIGGTLEIKSGAAVIGLDATTTKKGLVKKAANVPLAAGNTTTSAEFNALVNALIASGIMAAAN